jgi:hypothetical protein
VAAAAAADAIGAPETVQIMGGIAVAWAGVWFALSRRVGRSGLGATEEPDADAGAEPIPTIG